MRKRPIVRSTIIALSVAGIIAGTHAGIAAMNDEVTTNVTGPATLSAQPQDVAEAPAPAESTATIAQAPVEAQPDRVTSSDGASRDEQYVRIPFTNRHLKVSQPTFPGTGIETSEMLPSVVAYFDRRNAGIVLTGAASPVFPGEAADSPAMLPSVVAYFDRAASQNLASAQPAGDTTVAYAAQASPLPRM